MKRFPLFFQKNSHPQKMESRNGIIYEFDDFRLIPGEGLLLQDGEPISLSLKAFDTLVLLVERHGHLVQKSELIEEVWENAFVEDAAVSRCVWNIRNALGEDSKSSRFIQTIPRRGYRFVYPVSIVNDYSGVFRLEDLPGHDGERKPISNGTGNGASSVSTVSAEPPVRAADHVEEHPETLRSGKWSSLFFSRWVMLAGLVGIVVITVFVGYFSFVRKSSVPSHRSILVLPVTPINISDRDPLYEIGIADSLINQLSSTEGLVVRPLNAVREYEAPKDPVAVGREQGSEYVLASNYQIVDGKIKITSQLYNVATGQVEIALQSRQAVADVFAAQDAIATEIGGRIMEHLATPARAPLKKRGTDSTEAYLAYVQGMYLLDHLVPNLANNDNGNPLEFFERAVSLDPNYAKAWAGKAMAHNREVQRDGDRNSEHFLKAREAVDKALSIDPNESLAYTALCGRLLFTEWNYMASDETCRRSVELDPTSSFARSEYAVVLTSHGRFGEAFDQLEKAMETEGKSFRAQAFYANALYLSRRYEEAEAYFKGLVELKPDRPATYSWLIRVMEAQGKEAEAFEWTVKHMIVLNKGDEAIQRYKAAYQNSGYQGALRERINQDMMPVHAYVHLGDKDKAFEAIEERYRRHDYNLITYALVDPLYDPLRSDPRWADLVRRVEAGGNEFSEK